jgi:RNA polymerase sigma-70 factor (ECF subfamily)
MRGADGKFFCFPLRPFGDLPHPKGQMSRFVEIPLDAERLRQAAAGDRDAQRELYECLAGPVFGLIRRLVPQRAAAEDVFQDCMVSLLRHLPDFRGEAPFGAWVRQIALRACLMHQRSPWQRARRVLHSAMTGSDHESGAAVAGDLWQPRVEPPSAELIDLERALASLPDVARAVVWMHDVEGLSHEEIAALFGRTVSFSKSQLSRAHALLRARLCEPVPPAPLAQAMPAPGQVSP